MKKRLLTISALVMLSASFMAQDGSSNENSGKYPNTFSSGSSNVNLFTNASRKFNDWSVSFGAGLPLMQSADLISMNKDKTTIGYSFYGSLDKQVTHIFGVSAQFQMGKSKQNGSIYVPDKMKTAHAETDTDYKAISIIGDVNISNLLRRTDNMSPFRWALHGYAGVGVVGYKTYRQDDVVNVGQKWIVTDEPIGIGSVFSQYGLGLKYQVSNRIDVESRVMYFVSGDDEFDGGGDYPTEYPGFNTINKSLSDNMFVATLGLSVKLGKHASHLAWHDPLQEVYYKMDVLDKKSQDFIVCEKGDKDSDGVCDDWDRELSTPKDARVDGAGVALDLDLDGVIDLNDKCVTIPGSISNNGCPEGVVEATAAPVEAPTTDVAAAATNALKNLLFDVNKSSIRPEGNVKLDNAAKIMKTTTSKLMIEGHTDSDGADAANMTLSANRAAAVVKALISRGIPTSQLVSKGYGETMPSCDNATKEGKQCNRRVEVKLIN